MPNKQQEWNVLLCDDEPLVLDRLLALSQKTLLPQYNAVFHCAAGAEALPDSSVQLHIAVLDIVLKQDNGISLARSIVEKFPECQIIFVSGYPQYVSDVYDVPHLGMVLKEQLENQLPKFLLRAASVLDSAQEETLTVLSNRVPLQLRLSGTSTWSGRTISPICICSPATPSAPARSSARSLPSSRAAPCAGAT